MKTMVQSVVADDKWEQNGYARDQHNSEEEWDRFSSGNGPRRCWLAGAGSCVLGG